VSTDLLEGWNASYRLAPGLVHPSDLLEKWLGERLEPGISRLDSLLGETFGVESVAATLVLEGLWYPNPVVFARGGGAPSPALRAAVGNTHGDLHGHNLLTNHRRQASDYFVIDLASYEDDSYLFFDHAYLELSYLLRAREDATTGRCLEVLEAVFGEPAVTADYVGMMRVVESLRTGQHEWIARHEQNRTSYMESQVTLAQVAAGLRFANMRVPVPMKVKALPLCSGRVEGIRGVAWSSMAPRRGDSHPGVIVRPRLASPARRR
jgi:hypothetical protein